MNEHLLLKLEKWRKEKNNREWYIKSPVSNSRFDTQSAIIISEGIHHAQITIDYKAMVLATNPEAMYDTLVDELIIKLAHYIEGDKDARQTSNKT